MNKQKTPVWLVIVVIVLLGIVAVINGRTRPAGEGEAPAPEAGADLQSKPITQGEKAKDKKDLSQGLPSPSKPGAVPSTALQERTPAPPKMKGMPENSISTPRRSDFKPKPEDSMTSGQWWTEGSLRKEQSEEKATTP